MQQTLFCAGAIMSPTVESSGAVSLAVAGHRLDLMQVVVVRCAIRRKFYHHFLVFARIRGSIRTLARIRMHSVAYLRTHLFTECVSCLKNVPILLSRLIVGNDAETRTNCYAALTCIIKACQPTVTETTLDERYIPKDVAAEMVRFRLNTY